MTIKLKQAYTIILITNKQTKHINKCVNKTLKQRQIRKHTKTNTRKYIIAIKQTKHKHTLKHPETTHKQTQTQKTNKKTKNKNI